MTSLAGALAAIISIAFDVSLVIFVTMVTIAGLGSVGTTAVLLFKEDDLALAASHVEARKCVDQQATLTANSKVMLLELTRRRGLAHARYRQAQSDYDSLRARLMRSHWRGMAGTEFEQFLVNVFHCNGCQVIHMGKSHDHGVDLIVIYRGLKLAIQAKGYPGSTVGNDAIQQAYSGKDIHKCDIAVVITNSRFTTHAKDAARRLGCYIIDGTMIPTLIEGRIQFCC